MFPPNERFNYCILKRSHFTPAKGVDNLMLKCWMQQVKIAQMGESFFD